MSFLDGYFRITERDSTVSREVMGGITTFLAMAYIIIVNPSILSLSGMDKGALITVTCLASSKTPFLIFMGSNNDTSKGYIATEDNFICNELYSDII